MLAGKIRLKTFLMGAGAVAVLGTGAAVVGGGWAIDSSMEAAEVRRAELEAKSRANAEEVARLRANRPQPVAAPSPPPPAPTPPAGGRPVDTIGVAYLGKDLGADKRKDVTAGKPYKINVYQDGGQKTVNRLKVDLDRDDKWDEKWTFTPDGITREVAPADDEVYTQSSTWTGSDWAEEGQPPTPDIPANLRPIDVYAMAYLGRDIASEKLKDVTKGQPYKLNVYQDAGHTSVNRVKLDLDRDDQWDESWAFDGDRITRKVSPNDDGNQSETFHWSGDDWVK